MKIDERVDIRLHAFLALMLYGNENGGQFHSSATSDEGDHGIHWIV
jgi:hypothetical protein